MHIVISPLRLLLIIIINVVVVVIIVIIIIIIIIILFRTYAFRRATAVELSFVWKIWKTDDEGMESFLGERQQDGQMEQYCNRWKTAGWRDGLIQPERRNDTTSENQQDGAKMEEWRKSRADRN